MYVDFDCYLCMLLLFIIAAEDSDDQTVSKHSLHDNRQDSWADDTDISSATDDHKLKVTHNLFLCISHKFGVFFK